MPIPLQPFLPRWDRWVRIGGRRRCSRSAGLHGPCSANAAPHRQRVQWRHCEIL